MNRENIFSTLQSIFQNHFKNDQLLLQESTAQNDIPQWDSLNHAVLIDKIEKQFAVKFDLMDMISMQNIGDICDKILVKTSN